ncbi:MAG: nucleotide exchange factor GrpE [Dehalococcoidia bacterium]|nr:nucleotide exchange factor GrpE [Dehalococcoidia bacterium]
MEQEGNDETQLLDGKMPPEDSMELGTPISLETQLDTLKAQAHEINREKDQFKDMLQSAQADLINYQRRSEEERHEQQKNMSSRIILKLLPIMDDFSMAIGHAADSGAEGPWLEGMKLIQRKLHSFLESENVTKIETEDKEFDPFEHEAMAYQESDKHRNGQIITVVRDGYKLHDRVIRPALVILANAPEASGPEGQAEAS